MLYLLCNTFVLLEDRTITWNDFKDQRLALQITNLSCMLCPHTSVVCYLWDRWQLPRMVFKDWRCGSQITMGLSNVLYPHSHTTWNFWGGHHPMIIPMQASLITKFLRASSLKGKCTFDDITSRFQFFQTMLKVLHREIDGFLRGSSSL